MTAPGLFDYRKVVGPDIIEELTILASHVGNRSIKMVNSTAVGGGVAESHDRGTSGLLIGGPRTGLGVLPSPIRI